MDDPARPRRSLLERWEALGRERQIQLAFPTLLVSITAIHFGIPGDRVWWSNLVYGFMYAFVLTAVVVGVTEGERRRRAAARDGGESDDAR